MRLRITLFLLGAWSCVLLLEGCAAGSGNAFPSAQEIVNRGSASATDTARLQRGRQLFASRCTEFHVARRISNYSVAQWQHYVGMMAPRAGLTPDDRAAVEDYVVKARQSIPSG